MRVVKNKNRQKNYVQEPYTPEYERLGVKPEPMFKDPHEMEVSQREAIIRRQMALPKQISESGNKNVTWTNQVQEGFVDDESTKLEVPKHLSKRNYEVDEFINDQIDQDIDNQSIDEDINISNFDYILLHDGDVLEVGNASEISDAILSMADNDINVNELTVFKKISFNLIPRKVDFDEKS